MTVPLTNELWLRAELSQSPAHRHKDRQGGGDRWRPGKSLSPSFPGKPSYDSIGVCVILRLLHPFPRPEAVQCPTHINRAHIGGGHRELEPPGRKAGSGSERAGQLPLRALLTKSESMLSLLGQTAHSPQQRCAPPELRLGHGELKVQVHHLYIVVRRANEKELHGAIRPSPSGANHVFMEFTETCTLQATTV